MGRDDWGGGATRAGAGGGATRAGAGGLASIPPSAHRVDPGARGEGDGLEQHAVFALARSGDQQTQPLDGGRHGSQQRLPQRTHHDGSQRYPSARLRAEAAVHGQMDATEGIAQQGQRQVQGHAELLVERAGTDLGDVQVP